MRTGLLEEIFVLLRFGLVKLFMAVVLSKTEVSVLLSVAVSLDRSYA